MADSTRPTVLHVTSAAGGGVDRHIRDIAATLPGPHWIWHVGRELDVLEDVGAARFWPLRPASAAIAGWLVHAGVALVHLHGVDRPCRERLAALRAAGAARFIATLHDLSFAHPEPFAHDGSPPPAPDWTAEVAATLEHAGCVIAPSRYLRDEALRLMPRLAVTELAPGISIPTSAGAVSNAPPDDFLAQAPAHVVAAVGAIGSHKGSALLAPLAEQLGDAHAALVVIGYTDGRLARGWEIPGRLYVHGPYVDDDLARWLAAYAPAIVLFPNRLPESFSYTLSEVWAAGLPVIVPDAGALGERVGRLGGGWRLPADFAPGDAAQLIAHLLSPAGHAEWARVKSAVVPSDPARVPPLGAMTSALVAIYEHFGVPAQDAGRANDGEVGIEALQHLLSANLEGFAFRQELVQLCEALAVAREGQAADREWVVKLQQDLGTTEAWARKVERDVATLNAEVARRDESMNRLREEIALLAPVQAVLARLPGPLRRWLLRKAARVRR